MLSYCIMKYLITDNAIQKLAHKAGKRKLSRTKVTQIRNKVGGFLSQTGRRAKVFANLKHNKSVSLSDMTAALQVGGLRTCIHAKGLRGGKRSRRRTQKNTRGQRGGASPAIPANLNIPYAKYCNGFSTLSQCVRDVAVNCPSGETSSEQAGGRRKQRGGVNYTGYCDGHLTQCVRSDVACPSEVSGGKRSLRRSAGIISKRSLKKILASQKVSQRALSALSSAADAKAVSLM